MVILSAAVDVNVLQRLSIQSGSHHFGHRTVGTHPHGEPRLLVGHALRCAQGVRLRQTAAEVVTVEEVAPAGEPAEHIVFNQEPLGISGHHLTGSSAHLGCRGHTVGIIALRDEVIGIR